MNKWLVSGIGMFAAAFISLVGGIIRGLLHALDQPAGLSIPAVLIRAAAAGWDEFVNLMGLCVSIGAVVAAVAALSGLRRLASATDSGVEVRGDSR